jgi:hypothetical protein
MKESRKQQEMKRNTVTRDNYDIEMLTHLPSKKLEVLENLM